MNSTCVLFPLPWAGGQHALALGRTLANGMQLAAVRRAKVPLVHLRLRVASPARGPEETMARLLLARTMGHEGVTWRGSADLARAGGTVHVSCDADGYLVRGQVLREGLGCLLTVVSDLVTSPVRIEDSLAAEARALAEEVRRLRAAALPTARHTLMAHLYGSHPYASTLPSTEDDPSTVTSSALTDQHRRLGPTGGVLVLVGDLEPTVALDLAEAMLGSWSGTCAPPTSRPHVPVGRGAVTFVHRRDSVQSCIVGGGAAPARGDPNYAAFELASLALGGYFASRIVLNLREEKGISYSPSTDVHHAVDASWFEVVADVAPGATVLALHEIRAELKGLAMRPPGEAELRGARRYAEGSYMRVAATQAALTRALEWILSAGLDPSWPQEHLAKLGRVTSDALRDQASRLLNPDQLHFVVVGDRARIQTPLSLAEGAGSKPPLG